MEGKGEAASFSKVGKPVDQIAEQPDVYTDGSCTAPTAPAYSLLGFGTWWPEIDDTRRCIADLNVNLFHHQAWEGGMAAWAPLKPIWNSSTQAELAALIVATTGVFTAQSRHR